MKLCFVIVAVLAYASSVYSIPDPPTPQEMTDMQDEIQAFVNNLIVQGNDLRDALLNEIYSTNSGVVQGLYMGLAQFEQSFLTGMLIHLGTRAKEQAAVIREYSRQIRAHMRWLLSATRLNEAMLSYFTNLIGPMIAEEYPLVAFQEAFDFDATAAYACWATVKTAVNTAMTAFNTANAANIGTADGYGYFDQNGDLGDVIDELMEYLDVLTHIIESCASGETIEDDIECVLNGVQVRLDNADSIYGGWHRRLEAAFDLTQVTIDTIAAIGPVQDAWDQNIQGYYECVFALYEAGNSPS